MKRIGWFGIFLFFYVQAISRPFHEKTDSTKNKFTTQVLAQDRLSSFGTIGTIKPFFAKADTLPNPYYNSLPDTSLVLSRDFPTPVDENSYFENELYNKRLDSLKKQVPLTYNAYVQSYINLYLYKRRAQIEKLLGEGQFYFPIFAKALSEYGLPLELKYLPIIESALNPMAVSRAGATGPWQFMYGTAMDYGLQINPNRDERKDPYRSTQAAAQYFKDMYNRYGNWLLVLASYNCGKGNIDKAIRKAGGSKDFWVIRRFLPRETRSYVPAFIAATYIMNYAGFHGLHRQSFDLGVHPDSIKIEQRVSLFALASSICVSQDIIKRLNPQFRSGWVEATMASPIWVWLPSGNALQANRFLSQIINHPELNTQPLIVERWSILKKMFHYRVKKGDTLGSIAQHFNVSIGHIKGLNRLHSNLVRTGQNLKLNNRI